MRRRHDALFFGARTPGELPYFGPLKKVPETLLNKHLVFSRIPGAPKEYVQDSCASSRDRSAISWAIPTPTSMSAGFAAWRRASREPLWNIAEATALPWARCATRCVRKAATTARPIDRRGLRRKSPLRSFRRVGWGDCDPARIAFTGRLAAFALEAIDAWWGARRRRRLVSDEHRSRGRHPFRAHDAGFSQPGDAAPQTGMRSQAVATGREFCPTRGAGAAGWQTLLEGQFVQALLRAPDYIKFEVPEDVLAKLRWTFAGQSRWEGPDEIALDRGPA